MLRRASVADVKAGRVVRGPSYVVVVMLHYPRFLAGEMRDEYVRELAPEAKLFTEFKAKERATGDHDGAFAKVSYERRFWLNKAGLGELARLSGLARSGMDVVLVCQCTGEQRCHADLLLLMAKRLHGVETIGPAREYPVFAPRVAAWVADF